MRVTSTQWRGERELHAAGASETPAASQRRSEGCRAEVVDAVTRDVTRCGTMMLVTMTMMVSSLCSEHL